MRGLYSTTDFSGYGGNRVFVKTYDNIVPQESVVDEYVKSEKIYNLRIPGCYIYPRPVGISGRTLVSEVLPDGFINLVDFLIKNNSRKHTDIVAVKRVMRRCGLILGTIHNDLVLDKKDSLGWNIVPQHKVFLYTDYGLKSILVRDDGDIALIDPSFTLITDYKVSLYDSFYYDLAYFIFSINYLIPLKCRTNYQFQNTNTFINEFLLYYHIGTRFTIVPSLIKRYEDKIKEKYLTTLTGWKGKLWRRIINEPNPFYKQDKIFHHFQGSPPWGNR